VVGVLPDLFDKYEFLTTVVPGAALLIAVLVILLPVGAFGLQLSPESLVLLTIVVFLAGEVMAMFADTTDPGQESFAFSVLLMELRDELGELDATVRATIGDRIRDLQREEFADESVGETVSFLSELGYSLERTEEFEWTADDRKRWAWANTLALVRENERSRDARGLWFRPPEKETWRSVLDLVRLQWAVSMQGIHVRRPEYEGRILHTAQHRPFERGEYEHPPQFDRLREWIRREESEVVDAWFEDEVWQRLRQWTSLCQLQSDARYLQLGIVVNTKYHLLQRAQMIQERWIQSRVLILGSAFLFWLTAPSVSATFQSYYTRTNTEESRFVQTLVRRLRLPSLAKRYEQLYYPTQDVLASSGVPAYVSDRIDSSPEAMKRVNDEFDEFAEDLTFNPLFGEFALNIAQKELYRSYTDLFRLVFTAVESDLGPQANRFRARSTFHRNMHSTLWVIFVLYAVTAAVSSVAGVIEFVGVGLPGLGVELLGVGWLVVGALLAFVLIVAFTIWSTKSEQEYVRYLIATFRLKYENEA
jgi:hypothetical protein